MPGSKKDRKNGKDSGGVVAAVTKLGGVAPKFINENASAAKVMSSSPSASSSTQSPVMRPFPSSSAEIAGASPLLDAICSTPFATSNSANMREWTKTVAAGMAGSPGNLISLVGDSPPTAPSSYEDTKGLPSGWSSPRPVVAYHAHSASPPSAARRPLSFQMDGRYSPPESHAESHAASAAIGTRRSSVHSHFTQARGIAAPPLPHQPQAHFYGVPDLDFDFQPQTGMKAGAEGYYFGFDVLPAARPRHVALAGFEGGLHVHLVGRKRLERLTGLKGLRGGVHHAKILPWTGHGAGADVYPLVALVIHGPCLPSTTPGINADGDYDAVSAERSEAMARVNSSDALSRDGMSSPTAPGVIDTYQTTVEVYSLKTGKPVARLLEAVKINLKMPITSPYFKAPPPSGAFHIRADASDLVVSSGMTGECWVYRQQPVSQPDDAVQFRCLGKIWTTLQQPPKGDAAQDAAERGRVPAPPRPRPQSAILSMTDRWIAYCPAAPSTPLSLRAVVTVPSQGRAPGLSSVTSPQLPPVITDLDLPPNEGVMNKIMRDATQELIHGAKWVGKQGLQAWHNYWSPQTNPASQMPMMKPQPQVWGQDLPSFPPTHGTVTPATPKEPRLVSILDTKTMGYSANLHPIATFAVPEGCSFLSFSPTGLALFTASSKGDVQTVWDLMRLQHTKSSPLQASPSLFSGGSRVRQIAQFSRMTVARIVEVAWAKPNGERLAMVTERGTVHLLHLPAMAFAWPPPRRRLHPPEAITTEATPTSAVSMASSALSTVRDAARPLMNRPRRSSSNVSQLTGAGLGDYATHGGKAIAATISHSLGKTGSAINQLRHTGDNRVALPISSSSPGSSCVAWMRGRQDHHLYVLGDGLVRTFPTKAWRTAKGGDRRAPRLNRSKDFKLPLLPDDAIAPAVKAIVDPDEYLDLAEKESDSGNQNDTMVLDCRLPPYMASAESSIPQAEIESSAPYQPFHTDRRVALFEFAHPTQTPITATTSLQDGLALETSRLKRNVKIKRILSPRELIDVGEDDSVENPSPPAPTRSRDRGRGNNESKSWVFGQPIPAVQLDTGLQRVSEEESFSISHDDTRALPASAMERVLTHDEQDQIVVTTRRRRGAGRTNGSGELDEDGFFEDDCEVLDFADQRV